MTARARALYRTLLRTIAALPPTARPYYAAHVRGGFIAFADEADPARLAAVEARARADAAWVLAKYTGPDAVPVTKPWP